MRSAANPTLRNNRSFIRRCRAEKGWIGLKVLPVPDGNTDLLSSAAKYLRVLYKSIPRQSMGIKSKVKCLAVERWCSTLHNACSAVEECRGSKTVCRSFQRQEKCWRLSLQLPSEVPRGRPCTVYPTFVHHQVWI